MIIFGFPIPYRGLFSGASGSGSGSRLLVMAFADEGIRQPLRTTQQKVTGKHEPLDDRYIYIMNMKTVYKSDDVSAHEGCDVKRKYKFKLPNCDPHKGNRTQIAYHFFCAIAATTQQNK